jgi:hypothetical protein
MQQKSFGNVIGINMEELSTYLFCNEYFCIRLECLTNTLYVYSRYAAYC